MAFCDWKQPPWAVASAFPGMLCCAGERVVVLCAPEDMWMPLWKWDQMLKACPGIQACTTAHAEPRFRNAP